jgi:hypothetical protein
MSITSASANFGLSATGTTDRPNMSGSMILGQSASGMSLIGAGQVFHAKLYLQDLADEATLDTTDFDVTIDTNAAVAATGILTMTGNAVAGNTVTIGTTVYTFRATVPAAFDVLIGATASDSLDNLIAAINLAAGAGSLYGTGTTAHPTVSVVAGAGDTMDLTADTAGETGNSIATTETLTNGSFAAVTLTGGANANSWEGAANNFQGGEYVANDDVQGLLVYCLTGAVIVSNLTDLVLPISAGSKGLLANPAGISELLGTLTFTADANDTEVLISAIATL